MKKLLFGAIGLITFGLAVPAAAADLAARPYTKAPPPIAAPVYDWAGFYIGGNGGGGWSRKCWDATDAFGTLIATEGCHDATGAVAGGQVGYRWQTGAFVFGLEAQGDWADLRGSNVSLLFPAFTNRSHIDAFGLFTGQIGYAWNNVLLYAKGGAALASDSYDVITTATSVLAATGGSENRWGSTVGAGLEIGFAPNWSVAFEYDHLFLDSKLITFQAVPAFPIPFGFDRIHQDADLATVRINYRFGGPVVARY